jgi:hypothetical protein
VHTQRGERLHHKVCHKPLTRPLERRMGNRGRIQCGSRFITITIIRRTGPLRHFLLVLQKSSFPKFHYDSSHILPSFRGLAAWIGKLENWKTGKREYQGLRLKVIRALKEHFGNRLAISSTACSEISSIQGCAGTKLQGWAARDSRRDSWSARYRGNQVTMHVEGREEDGREEEDDFDGSQARLVSHPITT